MSEHTSKKRQAAQNLHKYDLLKKHHKFLRDSDSEEQQRQRRQNMDIRQKKAEQLAKKYYDKLYKEYALVNLARFQKGQIGCRWRTEKQVLQGKGETLCGEVLCKNRSENVFEMNFGYTEEGQRKNALVKVSVCKDCGFKLNYKKVLKKVS